MKRILIISVIGLLLASCAENPNDKTVSVEKDQIVGDWRYSKEILYSGAVEIDDAAHPNRYYGFLNSDTLKDIHTDSSGNILFVMDLGLWELVGDNIIQWKDMSGNDCLEYTVIEYTENLLVLERNDNSVCPSDRKQLFFEK